MKLLAIAGALALVSTSACTTMNGALAPASSDQVKQVVANLKTFNDAAKEGPCAGWGNVDWNPPLPPTGGLHVKCEFGNPNVGGAPFTGNPVPVSQVNKDTLARPQ